jgi:hypothetical protein
LNRYEEILSHSHLRNSLLGSYDFGGEILLFQGSASPAEMRAVLTHEEAHRNLSTHTIFGWYQSSLASLLKRDPSLFRHNTKTLTLSIDKSWMTHEGWACFAEIHESLLFGRPLSTAYPSRYREAMGVFFEGIKDYRLRPYAYFVARTFAEVAMNPPNFLLDFGNIFDEGWLESYLMSVPNQPDWRLLSVVECIVSNDVSELAMKLDSIAEGIADKFGIGSVIQALDLCLLPHDPSLLIEGRSLRSHFVLEIIPAIEEFIRSRSGLEFVPGEDAINSLNELLSSEINHHQLPRLRLLKDNSEAWPVVAKMYDFEVVDDDVFWDTGQNLESCASEEIDIILAELLAGWPEFLVAWILPPSLVLFPINKKLSPGGSEYVEIRSFNEGRTRLLKPDYWLTASQERITLRLPPNKYVEVLRFVSEKLLASVIVLLNLEQEATDWPTLQTIGKAGFDSVPITFIKRQTNIDNWLSLKALMNLGDKKLFRVFDRELTTYLFIQEGPGGPLLLCLNKGFVGMLKTYDTDMFDYIERNACELTENDTGVEQDAYIISIMDTLGSFSKFASFA